MSDIHDPRRVAAQSRPDTSAILPENLLDVHAICDQRDAAIKRADAAEAEVQRLREALEEIRDEAFITGRNAIFDTARAALAKGDK